MEIVLFNYDKIVTKNFLLYLSHFRLLHHFVDLIFSFQNEEILTKLKKDLHLFFPYYYNSLKETFSFTSLLQNKREFYLPLRGRESDTYEECASMIKSKQIILISKKEKHFLWKTILRREGGIAFKNIIFLTKKSFAQILFSAVDFKNFDFSEKEDPLHIKKKTLIFCEFFTNRKNQSQTLLKQWRPYFLEKECTLFYIDEVESFLNFKKELPNLTEEQFFINFCPQHFNFKKNHVFGEKCNVIYPILKEECTSKNEVKIIQCRLNNESLYKNFYVVVYNNRSILPLTKSFRNIKVYHYTEWYLRFLFDYSLSLIGEENDLLEYGGNSLNSTGESTLLAYACREGETLLISPLLERKLFFYIKSE